MPVTVDVLVAEGSAAIRRGDAAAARDAFEQAVGEAQTGVVLDGLAQATYLDRDYGDAIAIWERAFACYRAEENHVGAVQVARKLAFMYGSVLGDFAVMRGWLARAQTLLGAGPCSREAGWVAQTLGMFEPDPVRREEHFRAALDIARSVGDRDLAFSTLARLGA